MTGLGSPTKEWSKTTYGKVVKYDIVSEGIVSGIGHTDKPGGSVLIEIVGTRPLQGTDTQQIEVYR